MHYYKRNIGDYHRKAGRLSILQHGVYTLLIDGCYDREYFPTKDEAIDWCWASTTEEIEAVEFVLKKFFILDGEMYIQKRIKKEVDEYQNFCKTQQEKGVKGGRPKKPAGFNKKPTGLDIKPTGKQTGSEKNPKPLTNKPLTNNTPLNPPEGEWVLPAEIDVDVWAEFEQHRAEIKKPLSDLARTKAANVLIGCSVDQQKRIVDKTIQNRWTGLFAEDKSAGGKYSPPPWAVIRPDGTFYDQKARKYYSATTGEVVRRAHV